MLNRIRSKQGAADSGSIHGVQSLIGGSGVSLDGKSLMLPEDNDEISSINTSNHGGVGGSYGRDGTGFKIIGIGGTSDDGDMEVGIRAEDSPANHPGSPQDYVDGGIGEVKAAEASGHDDDNEEGGGWLPLWLAEAPGWVKVVIVLSTALLLAAVLLIAIAAALAVQENNKEKSQLAQSPGTPPTSPPFAIPLPPTSPPIAIPLPPSSSPTPVPSALPKPPTLAPVTSAPTTMVPSLLPSTEPTGPTASPTTSAPSGTPQPTVTASSAPSSNPSVAPSSAPSSSPSTPLPTASDTAIPSTTPTMTATMVSSSIAPTVTASASPTQAQLLPTMAPTFFYENRATVFYATAGRFRDANQQLSNLIDGLPTLPENNDTSFLVHLGDWNSVVLTDCDESAYIAENRRYSNSSVPVYFVPGDNEFNDCGDPEEALGFWYEHLLNYEVRYWDPPKYWVITRQVPNYPENFAFVFNGLLFVGINLVGGFVHDAQEWADRHEACLQWIDRNVALHRNQVDAMVVFAHADPDLQQNSNFFEPFAQRVGDNYDGLLTIFMHRNIGVESWGVELSFMGLDNFVLVVVEASIWPPLRVRIDVGRGTFDVNQDDWYEDTVIDTAVARCSPGEVC